MAQLVTREDAQLHRRAVAARFGDRIAAGDAAFMAAAFDWSAPALPITVVGGEPRSFGGFNRWMLAQVMRDRKWADPRFFSAAQVELEGWSLTPGAPAVVLQFVSAVDGQGRAVAPKIMRVPVYNAAAIDGVPPMSPPQPKLRTESLAQALQDAYIEPGANPATALAEWVREIRREVAWPGLPNAPYVDALAEAMAITAIASRVDVEREQALAQTTAQLRAQAAAAPDLFKRDAAAFFAAVKVAELCSARAISLVEKAEVSRSEFASLEAPKHIEPAASHGEQMSAPNSNGRKMASPRVQALYEGRQAVLAVPFKEKDEASRLGAVFYPPLTVWFVPQGVDLRAFQKWDTSGHSLGEVASEREIIEQFRRDMEALGLEAPMAIEADGKWHNVKITNHAKGKKPKSGAYLLDLRGGNDGTPRGQINNKYSGESMNWVFEGPLLTPEQKARMREAVRQRAQAAEQMATKARDLAAVHAGEILAQGQSAERHPYVLRKGISAEGLCQVPGAVLLQYSEFKGEEGRSAIRPNEPYLLVPMSDYEGRLRAVQAINHDGSVKSFMRGAQKQGTAFVLGAPSLKALCEAPLPAAAVAFAEGVATGASFKRPTGLPVVVCFDAGNIEVIAAQLARIFPMDTLPVFAVDNDQFHVESALGLLASRLGVNPNSGAGSTVEVLSGLSSTRLVSLGDAVADGEWHQAPRGRYRMSLAREPDSTEVRSIELQILVDGQERANTFSFLNRGVEAGRAARAAFDLARPTGKQAVMVVPEFRDLSSRPTDWNDLAKIQGFGAIGQQAMRVIEQHLPRQAPMERDVPARLNAGISR